MFSKIKTYKSNLPLALAIAFFAVVLFRTAWVCDDAFITFRTADNFVHGYGLGWNAYERVQSYTNPLWMFLFSAFYVFTGKPYYTSLFLSMSLSLGTVILFARKSVISGLRNSAVLGILVLAMSVAYVEYSTSGSENPLTHLLLLVFLLVYLSETDRNILWLSFLAALAALNRMDTILLFLPALVHLLASKASRRDVMRMALGMTPLFLWMGFSLFYYGSLLPNTAYAKLNNQITALVLARQGSYYLWNSLKTDPITLSTILCALAFAWRRRKTPYLCVALGIVLYLFYIVKVGGDFMSGRFLTGPLLAAVVLLGSIRWTSTRALVGAASGIWLLGFLASHPTALSGADFGLSSEEFWPRIVAEHGIGDERLFYYKGTGLLRVLQQPGPSDGSDEGISDPSVAEGKSIRAIAGVMKGKKVVPLGAMGFMGFYAGQEVHVIDYFALGDALLARIPPNPDPFWRIGHFFRELPAGYLETLRNGQNQLRDPGLAEYYTLLSLITRGKLWDANRLAAIWNLNLGKYDRLLEPASRKIRATPTAAFLLKPARREAIAELSRSIEQDPGDATRYISRGELHLRFGDAIQSVDDFSRAIELDRTSGVAYFPTGHRLRNEWSAFQSDRGLQPSHRAGTG